MAMTPRSPARRRPIGAGAGSPDRRDGGTALSGHRQVHFAELRDGNRYFITLSQPFRLDETPEEDEFSAAQSQAPCTARIGEPGQGFERMSHDRGSRPTPNFAA